MSRATLRSRIRRRLRAQDGFTMIVALGILTITMLLTGALLLAVQSDAGLTRDDLDGKQAYAAAQAGLQAYLFNLNHNSAASKWWQTCTNDAGNAAVPGNSGESYTFAPVLPNCATKGAVGTVLDPLTGQLRIKFTGTAGTATRTVVASFRTLSPLSYLWYTVYETADPVVDSEVNANGGGCGTFYWQTPGPPASCEIQWATGDSVNGPMYTQDEFLMGGTPRFGRSSSDSIASSAPESHVCVAPQQNGGVVQEACPQGVLQGTEDPSAQPVPLPTDNSSLESDAQANGVVLSGTTTLTVSNGTAQALTCDGTHACRSLTINLTKTPIIYVANASGCSESYTPSQVGAAPTDAKGDLVGPCGDVYLQASTYNVPVTIASENDIVVQGDVLNANVDPSTGMPLSTSTATLGLVADQYVRVGHPATFTTDSSGKTTCSAANPDRTIDAAVLTLQHSFFVDNYDCGNSTGYGKLTVNGAIAQKFRGIVALEANQAPYPGYKKNYNYDNRLAYLLPPYMFDLQDASWQVVRETLCAAGLPSTSIQSCQYTGTGS